jgi:hypothetical protein
VIRDLPKPSQERARGGTPQTMCTRWSGPSYAALGRAAVPVGGRRLARPTKMIEQTFQLRSSTTSCCRGRLAWRSTSVGTDRAEGASSSSAAIKRIRTRSRLPSTPGIGACDPSARSTSHGKRVRSWRFPLHYQARRQEGLSRSSERDASSRLVTHTAQDLSASQSGLSAADRSRW